MDKKFCFNIDEETLQQLKYLGRRFGVSPTLSRSQFIREVIEHCYLSEVEVAAEPPTDPPKWHGFAGCSDDCELCPDDSICDYTTAIDRFII